MMMELRIISILVLSIRCTPQCIRCDIHNVGNIPSQIVIEQLYPTDNERICCPTPSHSPPTQHVLVWYGTQSSTAQQATGISSSTTASGQAYGSESALSSLPTSSFVMVSHPNRGMNAGSDYPKTFEQVNTVTNSQGTSIPHYSAQDGNSPLCQEIRRMIPINNGEYNGPNTEFQVVPLHLKDAYLTSSPCSNQMVNQQISQYPNNYDAGNIVEIGQYQQGSQNRYNEANVDIADDSRASQKNPYTVFPYHLQTNTFYDGRSQDNGIESSGRRGFLTSAKSYDDARRQENSYTAENREMLSLTRITADPESIHAEYILPSTSNQKQGMSYDDRPEHSYQRTPADNAWAENERFPFITPLHSTATPFQQLFQSSKPQNLYNPQGLVTSSPPLHLHSSFPPPKTPNYYPTSQLLGIPTVTSLSTTRHTDEENDISEQFSPTAVVSTRSTLHVPSSIPSARLRSILDDETETSVASGNKFGATIYSQTAANEASVQPDEQALKQQYLTTSSSPLYTQTNTERNSIFLTATDSPGFGFSQHDFEDDMNTIYGKYGRLQEQDATRGQNEPTYSNFSNGAEFVPVVIIAAFLVFAI